MGGKKGSGGAGTEEESEVSARKTDLDGPNFENEFLLNITRNSGS